MYLRSLLPIGLLLCAHIASAQALKDLSAGQTGKFQFTSSNPESLWTLLRGNAGPAVAVTGDLMLPQESVGKVPAVIFSHGSEGVSALYYEVWAKSLLAEGYAVFIMDSFAARGVTNIRGTTSQLNWNTTRNISDALHALKVLDTHPRIDAHRIFHMGWSRGGLPVLTTMWPTLQAVMLRPGLRWAGSVAVYPGCNLRWRFAPEEKIAAPVLLLLGSADDMTPASQCVAYAEQLKSEGHAVSHIVYEGARHVFDRIDWPLTRAQQGTYRRCDIEVTIPVAPAVFGAGVDRLTGKTLRLGSEFAAASRACEEIGEVSGESNPLARDKAVSDVLDFMNRISMRGARPRPPAASKPSTADLELRAQEIFKSLNFK